jgi:AAA domain, putative AbiEii toxin, Type IV TA system/Protein of unknown function (DUF4435)
VTGANDPLGRWSVPGSDGATTYELVAQAGQVTVVVGANGSGKSALGYWLEANRAGAVVRRLIAHRRLWFEHAGPDITPALRGQLGSNMAAWSAQPESRWLDHAQAQRASAVLFDLLSRVNERNARVAALIDGDADAAAIRDQVEPSLLTRVNSILRHAHLDVELILTDSGVFDARSERTGTRYPISQMSDGEKSALLLAAELLMAPDSCIQIIDEPERHLHRSISAGLIEAVLAERPDCHFVVLTHDLELASLLASAAAQLLVLSGCIWAGSGANGWVLHALDATTPLPDTVRSAILGGKSHLLFLEGESQSLDSRLYSILFPNWGLNPVGGCEQVIRAVVGLSTSAPHHWVEGRGIVDRDGRDEDESAALKEKGILVLPVHEIESLYYLPTLMSAVAEQQAAMQEGDPSELLQSAVDAALKALAPSETSERLAAALAAQMVARKAAASAPDAAELKAGQPTVSFEVESSFVTLLARFQQCLAERDLEQLVRKFPIRETAMRAVVARALGFTDHEKYEAAVRSCLRADEALLRALRATIDPIP